MCFDQVIDDTAGPILVFHGYGGNAQGFRCGFIKEYHREISLVEGGDLTDIQVPEAQIMETLRTLNIDSMVKGFGGLDQRQHWENILPLDQQQIVVLARVLLSKPRFVFLDRPSTTLGSERVEWILNLLNENAIPYVTFESDENLLNADRYDSALEIKEGGTWEFKPAKELQMTEETRQVMS